MIDPKKYMDAFLSEAEELLQSMNNALLELEKNPAGKETVNQLFRCAHSIKGMSAMMGFNQTAELSHSMESLMDTFRSGNATPDAKTFSLLFECADALERSIKTITAGGMEPDTGELKARTEAAAKRTETPQEKNEPAEKQAPAQKEAEGAHAFSLSTFLREDCQMKPLKFELVRSRLSKIGRIAKEEKIKENQTDYLLLTDEGMKRAEAEAGSVSGVEKVEVRTRSGAEIKKKDEQAGQRTEQPAHIKVPVQRLDNLINLAGELTTAKTRIKQLTPDNNPALAGAIANLERLTQEIQTETMLARMVPVEQVFEKFPRMVRDLAKEEGKEVNFVMDGTNIELDRSILDRISEPLVHLLRNAVDHGIETPKERQTAGKPAAGTVTLCARREKSGIVVEVSDDGRGIDAGEIKRTALEKKIADKSEIEKMDEKDIPWLLFRPGFSTNKKITGISGRGVGLNAVKTAAESTGGMVEVESEKGKGSKFTLHLPLSLAIVRSLLVGSGSDEYAIPLSCIQYIHKAGGNEIRTIQKRKAIILEGQAVPLIGLHELFKTPEGGGESTILVIKKGREKAGIAVDRIIGEQELMIKPLRHAAAGFSGASILPDGKVVLVPDIYGLV